jgi:lysozyme
MTRPIPDSALDLITRWEGCKLTAYLCPAGVWTIGYGSTGQHVVKGLKITKAQALALLKDDLRVAAERLRLRIGVIADELTANQYGALLSFVFNLGATPNWTIWKILKARAFEQVPMQLMRFTKARDPATGQLVTVRGLVNRRTDEVRLWSLEDEHEEPVALPSSTTRAVDTPPAPMEKPLATSKSFVASCAGAVAMAPVAINQVSETIKPYAEQSPVLGQVLGTLAVIGAALAVAALVFQWLKARNGRR